MFGDFRIDDNFNKDNNIKVYTNEDYTITLIMFYPSFASFYSQRFGNAILFNNRKYNIVDEVIFNNDTIVYPTCNGENNEPTFEKNIEIDNETRSIGGVLLQKSDETNKKFITCVTHTTEKVITLRTEDLIILMVTTKIRFRKL